MDSNIAKTDASTGFKLDAKRDLAGMLGVSERSVTNYMRAGLPYIKLGRSVRFDRVLVREWLNRSCAKGGL